MAHHDAARSVLRLAHNCRRLDLADPLTQCLAPRAARTFATPTQLPPIRAGPLPGSYLPQIEKRTPAPAGRPNPLLTNPPEVLTTLYSWPSFEPTSYKWYKAEHLDLPLRRDLLHRAVIFEGDATRQGTASTKHRTEVHGSNRKIRPQKGTGRARLGDKKSPMLKGGGVAHGPKPRDFSTGLQKQVYDKALRTALSYRYRKDELRILDGVVDLPRDATTWFMEYFFETHRLGKGHGRSMFVVNHVSKELKQVMDNLGMHGNVKDVLDVDVKDLLEKGTILMERQALDLLLAHYSSDLGGRWMSWKRLRLEAGHGGGESIVPGRVVADA